jgi:muconate cycloisomerase
MVNIKVLKCGGLLPSWEMASLCRAAHLPVMFGSMIEAGIGTLASAHLAMALPQVFSTELCGPLLLTDDLLIEPAVIRDGAMHLPDRPGIGAFIDESKLAKYRIDSRS